MSLHFGSSCHTLGMGDVCNELHCTGVFCLFYLFFALQICLRFFASLALGFLRKSLILMEIKYCIDEQCLGEFDSTSHLQSTWTETEPLCWVWCSVTRGRLARGACLKEIITCRWVCIPHPCHCWQSHTPPNAPLFMYTSPLESSCSFHLLFPLQFPHSIEKIRGLWNEARLRMLVSTVTVLALVQLSLVITLHLYIDPLLQHQT